MEWYNSWKEQRGTQALLQQREAIKTTADYWTTGPTPAIVAAAAVIVWHCMALGCDTVRQAQDLRGSGGLGVSLI